MKIEAAGQQLTPSPPQTTTLILTLTIALLFLVSVPFLVTSPCPIKTSTHSLQGPWVELETPRSSMADIGASSTVIRTESGVDPFGVMFSLPGHADSYQHPPELHQNVNTVFIHPPFQPHPVSQPLSTTCSAPHSFLPSNRKIYGRSKLPIINGP